jgi:hypothetical protein
MILFFFFLVWSLRNEPPSTLSSRMQPVIALKFGLDPREETSQVDVDGIIEDEFKDNEEAALHVDGISDEQFKDNEEAALEWVVGHHVSDVKMAPVIPWATSRHLRFLPACSG